MKSTNLADPQRPIVAAVAMAYCRPKMMKRIVHFLGQCEVQAIHFYRPFLSDKSYETSSFYSDKEILETYQLGLSQVRKTGNLDVTFHTHLRPFLEDFLSKKYERILVTEPDSVQAKKSEMNFQWDLLMFGPEKGYTDRELQMLKAMNLEMRSFSQSHFRLESAVPFIFGCLSGN
ncbi:MAG: 16S rRNA (uracil(1498)-N(3))-methyltransferase [Pseudomonadota bacterium]